MEHPEYLYKQNADGTYTVWYVDFTVCNQVATVKTEDEALEYVALYSILNPEANGANWA